MVQEGEKWSKMDGNLHKANNLCGKQAFFYISIFIFICILELRGPMAPLFQLLWMAWGPFGPPLFLFFFYFFVLFVFLPFCLFAFLSFCIFAFLSFCLFPFLPFCIFAFLSFCLFAFLPFCLFVTTIIIMGSISTATPFFVPIRQLTFYHTFYQTIYHKPLPILSPPHKVVCT